MSRVESNRLHLDPTGTRAGALLGIGELARASGLTVSALRFYDGAGLLVPAEVDERNGYRRYRVEQVTAARVVAVLRRVRMPLAEIAAVLKAVDDPFTVDHVLHGHVRRLEDGLAEARRELSRVRTLLAHEEITMSLSVTMAAADLAAAIDRVRFATSSDPNLPMLAGILCEIDAEAVRLVATDRFRMAVADARPLHVDGGSTSALLPTPFVDELRALATPDGAEVVTLHVSPGSVRAETGDREASAAPLDLEFPAYRRLLRDGGAHRVPVDVAEMVAALAEADRRPATADKGRAYDVVRLGLDESGAVSFGVDGGLLELGVNPEFLLEALAAAGSDQLVLDLDGPLDPLVLRDLAGGDNFSLLMPVRLDEPTAVRG